jgi:hypothetical protein
VQAAAGAAAALQPHTAVTPRRITVAQVAARRHLIITITTAPWGRRERLRCTAQRSEI